ncbi:unnamed protein product [Polarella glacialis]|uniref:AAA+ ATPase domain-containing protein n=1 Tax=Polarella glacialis TaxID=89957 RepID=A0A813G1K9_POLGL|nr:unnamed protein product [Polarella glacialis]
MAGAGGQAWPWEEPLKDVSSLKIGMPVQVLSDPADVLAAFLAERKRMPNQHGLQIPGKVARVERIDAQQQTVQCLFSTKKKKGPPARIWMVVGSLTKAATTEVELARLYLSWNFQKVTKEQDVSSVHTVTLHVLCLEAEPGDTLSFSDKVLPARTMHTAGFGHFYLEVVARGQAMSAEFSLTRGASKKTSLVAFTERLFGSHDDTESFRTVKAFTVGARVNHVFCGVSFKSQELAEEELASEFLRAFHMQLAGPQMGALPAAVAEEAAALIEQEPRISTLITVLRLFMTMRLQFGRAPRLTEFISKLSTSCSPDQALFAAIVLGSCAQPPGFLRNQAFPGCLVRLKESHTVSIGKRGNKTRPADTSSVEVEVLDVDPGPYGLLHVLTKAGLTEDVQPSQVAEVLLSDEPSPGWPTAAMLKVLATILRHQDLGENSFGGLGNFLMVLSMKHLGRSLTQGVAALLCRDAAAGGSHWVRFLGAVSSGQDALQDTCFDLASMLQNVSFDLGDVRQESKQSALKMLQEELAANGPLISALPEAAREAFCETLLVKARTLKNLLPILELCLEPSDFRADANSRRTSWWPASWWSGHGEGTNAAAAHGIEHLPPNPLLHAVLGSRAWQMREAVAFYGSGGLKKPDPPPLEELLKHFAATPILLRKELGLCFKDSMLKSVAPGRLPRVESKVKQSASVENLYAEALRTAQLSCLALSAQLAPLFALLEKVQLRAEAGKTEQPEHELAQIQDTRTTCTEIIAEALKSSLSGKDFPHGFLAVLRLLVHSPACQQLPVQLLEGAISGFISCRVTSLDRISWANRPSGNANNWARDGVTKVCAVVRAVSEIAAAVVPDGDKAAQMTLASDDQEMWLAGWNGWLETHMLSYIDAVPCESVLEALAALAGSRSGGENKAGSADAHDGPGSGRGLDVGRVARTALLRAVDGRAAEVVDDGDCFDRSVSYLLEAICQEGPVSFKEDRNACQQALSSVLDAVPDGKLSDASDLIGQAGQAWRNVIGRRAYLNLHIQQHFQFRRVLSFVDDTRNDMQSCRMSMGRARRLLEHSDSDLCELLVCGFQCLDQQLEDRQAAVHSAITIVRRSVRDFENASKLAQDFLHLCQKCQMKDSSGLLRKIHVILSRDEEAEVCSIEGHFQRRWWCPLKLEAKLTSLAECAAFACYILAEGADVSAAFGEPALDFLYESDEDEAAGAEDDELEHFEDHAVDEELPEHQVYARSGSRTCFWLACHLDILYVQFQHKWHEMLLEGNLLPWHEARKLIPLSDAEKVDEHMNTVAKVALLAAIPPSLIDDLKACARLPAASEDLSALCRAAEACGRSHGGRALSNRLDVLDKEATKSIGEVAQAVRQAEISSLHALRSEPASVAVAHALADAKELVAFLQPLLKDDLRPLHDAVEEHSDELIRSDTVFALLDVQRLLGELFKHLEIGQTGTTLEVGLFEKAICRAIGLPELDNAAGKLRTCAEHCHGLRRLYRGLANRQEVTAEKIESAVSTGHCSIRCHAGCVSVSMTYLRADTREVLIPRHEMVDLRARALLRQDDGRSSNKAGVRTWRSRPGAANQLHGDDDPMAMFVKQVDTLLALCESLEALREEGHWQLRSRSLTFQNPNALPDLQANHEALRRDLGEWSSLLAEARMLHPNLTYVHSMQHWLLDDFLSGVELDQPELRAAVSLLELALGNSLQPDDRDNLLELQQTGFGMQATTATTPTNAKEWLDRLGRRLDQTLGMVSGSAMLPPSLGNMESSLRSSLTPGQPRTAVARSPLDVLPLALSFYSSASRLPRASEMLFCQSDSSWSQIEAFLARCRHIPGLYCMLGVERLNYQKQHQLVERVREQAFKESGVNLVLVVLSEDSATANTVHVLMEIPALHANPLSRDGLQRLVGHMAPNICCIASEDAGCGKTETVRQRAHARKKTPLSVPLSGPLKASLLVRRLLEIDWRSFHCLHLDVGHSPAPKLLSDVLVQLALWGVLQAGAEVFTLPCNTVFVELGNLSDQGLLLDLPFCSLFPPLDMRFSWARFIISGSPRNPVQVVCQTLHAMDSGTLDVKKLELDAAAPLAADRCRELLASHVLPLFSGPPSFSALHTLLRVLATQLVSFSISAFFDCRTLRDNKLPSSLRSQLVKSLLVAATSFTARAVNASKFRQRQQVDGATDEALVVEFDNMSRWSDIRPMLLFHRFDRQTLTPVFRDEQNIPLDFKELFRSQGRQLPNYTGMHTAELEEKLGTIVLPFGATLGTREAGSSYVVSPDNFLKMVWIALRVESKVPVVIMGETGCGKTSLLRHLARLLNVDFRCINIHAGTTEEQLCAFLRDCAKATQQKGQPSLPFKEVWAFLDEINTCDHLGLISEALCHHRLMGKTLPHSLVLLAACNPYRRRAELSVDAQAAAAKESLSLSDTSRRRKHSELVYSVQALPEALLDYVWDFGELGRLEEKSYVQSMVGNLFPESESWTKALAQLIVMSQRFTAEHQPDCLLSLRDVKRCVDLVSWFTKHLRSRKKAKVFIPHYGHGSFYRKGKGRQNFDDGLTEEDLRLRAVLNALAVSYHCRLPERHLRNQYRRKVAEELRKAGHRPPDTGKDDEVGYLLKNEMWAYLEHMMLPPGTAKNETLLENVFVMMVCILNNIPVFVVGKPGTSKSLSLRVINANLRGPDSPNELWQSEPQVYIISYQGSEVSTSDGIEKVFERGKRHLASAAGRGTRVLVHFDEIGLAEASPNNPLKVLHAYLEPGYPLDRPEHAVVGLSNFPLDAAKMNRGITLMRPPPTAEDLIKTLAAICPNMEVDLRKELAYAYERYYTAQHIPDFHGLRDFYALARTLSARWPTGRKEQGEAILRAICRNFGGLPESEQVAVAMREKRMPASLARCPFLDYAAQILRRYQLNLSVETSSNAADILELISENLREKQKARHLMLVCSGEMQIASDLVQAAAKGQGRKITTMIGSTFRDDQTDHYSFNLLKRIVLCMERGDILVMQGLDCIYGSLYDMLNMSYTSLGSTLQCRIALGDADMLAQVHENFRCVVLQSVAELPRADAAFLNRFEKHQIGISDLDRNPVLREASEMVCRWAEQAVEPTRNHGAGAHAAAGLPQVLGGLPGLFVGWGPESAPSLVSHLHASQRRQVPGGLPHLPGAVPSYAAAAAGAVGSPQTWLKGKPAALLAQQAWEMLASLATVDGVLRATELSCWARDHAPEAKAWRARCLTRPQSLRAWLQGWASTASSAESNNHSPLGTIRLASVFTLSTQHVDLRTILQGLVPAFQVIAVDALSSELNLGHRIAEFLSQCPEPGSLLVLQCRADSPHANLVRHRVQAELQDGHRALLLLHGSRALLQGMSNQSAAGIAPRALRLNFLSAWTPVFLEQLEDPRDDEATSTTGTGCHTLTPKLCTELSLKELFAENGPLPFSKVLSEVISGCFWFIRYPPTRDAVDHVQLLNSVVAAVPILPPGDLVSVPAPARAECYTYHQHMQELRLPFVAHFADRIDEFRSLFLEHRLYEADSDDARLQDFRRAVESSIGHEDFAFLQKHARSYAEDLAALRLTAVPLRQEEQLRILRPLLSCRGAQQNDEDAGISLGVVEVHEFFWSQQSLLLAILRLLAAAPPSLRNIDAILRNFDDKPDLAYNLPDFAMLVVSFCCEALLPTQEVQAHLIAEWAPVSRRVLAAAQNLISQRLQLAASHHLLAHDASHALVPAIVEGKPSMSMMFLLRQLIEAGELQTYQIVL